MRSQLTYKYKLETLTAENDISYYLLGAFITDGCIHVAKTKKSPISASIASCDYDWLELIRKQLCPKKPIIKTETCFRTFYTYKKMTDWFIDHGVLPNKSLTCKVPNIPEQFIPDFLRGCIDGDGSLGLYNKSYKLKDGTKKIYKNIKNINCSLTSGSKDFINGISK